MKKIFGMGVYCFLFISHFSFSEVTTQVNEDIIVESSESPVYMGINGGFSSFSYTGDVNGNLEFSQNIFPSLGLFFGIPLEESIRLEGGVSYFQSGSSMKTRGKTEGVFKDSYLGFPLLAKYDFSKIEKESASFFFAGGFTPALLLDSKLEYSDSTFFTLTSETSPFALFANAGLGARFAVSSGKSIEFSAMFSRSLTNISQNMEAEVYSFGGIFLASLLF